MRIPVSSNSNNSSCCGLTLLLTLLLFVSFNGRNTVHAQGVVATETLIGIVGRDFILLGADSSQSQSILLTATHLDKISVLVDPFPEKSRGNHDNDEASTSSASPQSSQQQQQQTIVAAVAGDSANANSLIGWLRAMGRLQEYQGGVGCDVRMRHGGDDENDNDNVPSSSITVVAMAHLARHYIYQQLRTSTPCQVGMLLAGLLPRTTSTKPDGSLRIDDLDEMDDTESSLSSRVQAQVKMATSSLKRLPPTTEPETDKENDTLVTRTRQPSQSLMPHLFWLDEYGSLQHMKEYAVHGYASALVWSILDREYRPDLTRQEALDLMHRCFDQLRQRYLINPVAPCIKCLDAQHGCRLMS